MPIDETRTFLPVNIAVLTVSDTRDLASDRSGDTLAARIEAAGHHLVARAIERDEADAIEADTVGLRADLTIKGTTRPLTLKAKVTPVGDGGMRLTTKATVNRQDFGVDGNLVGMIGDNATLLGDVVFRRTQT